MYLPPNVNYIYFGANNESEFQVVKSICNSIIPIDIIETNSNVLEFDIKTKNLLSYDLDLFALGRDILELPPRDRNYIFVSKVDFIQALKRHT